MATYKYGFGFCSHVAQGASKPSDHDIKTGLMLGWRTRQEGMLIALTELQLINELILMGPEIEVTVYKSMLVEMGADSSRITNLITTQTTYGNATDVWHFCDERGISAGNYCFLSSDYHKQRVIETAKIHNLSVDHVYGTETLLCDAALIRGGVSELEKKREHIWAKIDPKEFHARTQWEQQGCVQIRLAPKTYTPKK